MKKPIIISILVLLTCSAIAQDDKPKKFHFGNKIGLNLSGLSSINYQNGMVDKQKRMVPHFLIGVYANYSINDYVGIQPELNYSIQGGELENWGVFKLHYLNLPLLVEVKPFKNISLGFLAGAQIGSLMSGLINDKYFSVYQDIGGAPLIILDVSAVIGAQYTFIKHLQLGFRYNAGLTGNYHFAIDNGKGARNNVLQLSVGWTF